MLQKAISTSPQVALRKESVDRNQLSLQRSSISCLVALRKESVDRNVIRITSIDSIIKSLSARRAWIEMDVTAKTGLFTSMSLSARRAWIEIILSR